MKKYLKVFVLSVLCLIPVFSFAQQATDQNNAGCVNITHNLRIGSKDASAGDEVSILQNFL